MDKNIKEMNNRMRMKYKRFIKNQWIQKKKKKQVSNVDKTEFGDY